MTIKPDTLPSPRPGPAIVPFEAGRIKGLLVALVVFLVFFGLVNLLSAAPLAFFDYLYISSGGMTLAIAAVGATIVILCGGFDLSAAAVVSLINVLAATVMTDSLANQLGVAVGGVVLGAVIGAINGYFVAYQRLQSIVVTLASMFIINGAALLWLDTPGGYVPPGFSNFFAGVAIDNLLPSAFLIVGAVIVVWLLVKNTRFGTGIYAIGSDEEAASFAGIDVPRTKFLAFVLAGAFYGLAGIVVTAQTSTGDPLLGRPLLLEIFTAVVLGGTVLGGGRGGCVGTILGAYSLMLIVNILLVLNVPAFYSTIVQGGILLLAAIGLSQSSFRESVRWLRSLGPTRTPVRELEPVQVSSRRSSGRDLSGWFATHRDTLSYVLPSYVMFALVLVAMSVLNGGISGGYINSLLLLSSFLIILALGQGAVILTGGLDLSVAWTITFCGVVLGDLASGSDMALVWAVPLVLAIGVVIGAVNGFFIVFFGLPAIVVTLAMNGVLQGLALLVTGGTPTGLAPGALRWVISGQIFGFAPISVFVIGFAAAAIFLLGYTNFGRRIYAVGSNARVAHLSGVNVGAIRVGVYALSGFCGALAGILMTGFSGRAILGMGDEYLLPSIAVVVIGGTLITGGRGRYVGMVGGVLLLVSLQILLAGTSLPSAMRDIVFGGVLLAAILTLRENG